MEEVRITLPDGSEKAFPKGTTVGEIINSTGIAKAAIGAKVNGKLADFWYEVDSDAALEPVKQGSEDGLALIRHTAAHVWPKPCSPFSPKRRSP